jgi:hypothetical protein
MSLSGLAPEHESELEAAGKIICSCAAPEFSRVRRPSLLDKVAIENRLADVLRARVDLSLAKGRKQAVAATAWREAVVALFRATIYLTD